MQLSMFNMSCKRKLYQILLLIPAVLAFWRVEQETHHEFKPSLGYTVRSCLKANKQKVKINKQIEID